MIRMPPAAPTTSRTPPLDESMTMTGVIEDSGRLPGWIVLVELELPMLVAPPAVPIFVVAVPVLLIFVTPVQQQAAEVDGTGKVDIYDAYLIAEYAVGLITKFPVQS